MGIRWPGPALIFRWRQWYQLGEFVGQDRRLSLDGASGTSLEPWLNDDRYAKIVRDFILFLSIDDGHAGPTIPNFTLFSLFAVIKVKWSFSLPNIILINNINK